MGTSISSPSGSSRATTSRAKRSRRTPSTSVTAPSNQIMTLRAAGTTSITPCGGVVSRSAVKPMTSTRESNFAKTASFPYGRTRTSVFDETDERYSLRKKSVLDGSRRRDRFDVVTVKTERPCLDSDGVAVYRGNAVVHRQRHDACCDLIRIVKHRARFATRDKTSSAEVRAIGVRLGDHRYRASNTLLPKL